MCIRDSDNSVNDDNDDDSVNDDNDDNDNDDDNDDDGNDDGDNFTAVGEEGATLLSTLEP